MAEIIIVDEFVEKAGKSLKSRSDYLFNRISRYHSILENIREEGIMEGETAEALDAFIVEVEKISNLTKQCRIGEVGSFGCKNYISRIEDADKDLYEA